MASLSEETVVATSPEATFAYVTDQARLAEWNDHVLSAEVVGGGPVAEGARLAQHRRRNNREFTLAFTVLVHEPPTRHVVTGSVFGVDTTVSFEISPAEQGSRVRMSADVGGSRLAPPPRAAGQPRDEEVHGESPRRTPSPPRRTGLDSTTAL